MQLNTDLIIFGGGIAGLWLLNRLHRTGYSCVLLEKDSLGGGQTLVSQGMVHGGLKYALGGALNSESETIAAMPNRWRQCLAGNDTVDLSDTTVLSDVFYMWSGASLASKFTGFAASKALRGRIDKLKAADYPEAFQHPKFKGNVYKLHDPVLDTHSLLDTLLTPCRDNAYRFDGAIRHVTQNDNGCCIEVGDSSQSLRLNAKLLITTAGKGSATLLAQLGLTLPQMQLRPLHQVAVTSPALPPLYAHALGHNAAPRLTVSSHRRANGDWTWFLGGELATAGVDRDAAAQIDFAKKELASLLPWQTLEGAQWRTVRVDRAEPKQQTLIKPDDAFAEFASNDVLVCWPTKLTLAPRLGDRVLQLLNERGIAPSNTQAPALGLAQADIAAKPWDALFTAEDAQ